MIKQAAIKKGSKIFVGRRHSDCFDAMASEGVIINAPPKEIQGFLTSDGIFVDREEAYRIAVECGQIKPKSKIEILISENLY